MLNVIKPKQETLKGNLRQLFKDRFDCYADVDSDNVIMAMTEDCFIETFKDWQQQQNNNLYSEEGVLKLLHNYRNHFELYRNIQVLPNDFFEWFNQNKKK